MAAQDYYNTGAGHPQTTYDNIPSTHGLDSAPSIPHLGGEGLSQDPYHHHYGQAPYNDGSHYDVADSLAGGRAGSQDPYADNIPLKQQASGLSPDPRKDQQSNPFQHADEAGSPTSPVDYSNKQPRRGLHGVITKRRPWFVYAMTLIQVAVFIGELVRNAILTQTPIQIHPQFNPTIGPSFYVLINMGARYNPCMRNTAGIQDTHPPPTFPCPNMTTLDPNSPQNHCTLSDLCGFSGVPNPTNTSNLNTMPQPNQWFRFIIPMFLHGGIIHIGFNMILQILLGGDMERSIGPLRFALVYFSSGIFGFVLGGNYAPDGIPVMGASGCLFGILALALLDLLYTWKARKSPWKELAFMALDIVISFVLGLLPYLDNFSHIGGFLMGLVLGLCLLRSPYALRQRISDTAAPYVSVLGSGPSQQSYVSMREFAKSPLSFFKGRKPLWWGWWFLRLAALFAVLITFIVLVNNYYKYHKECEWCKHFNCLPISNWCDIGNINIQKTNQTTNP